MYTVASRCFAVEPLTSASFDQPHGSSQALLPLTPKGLRNPPLQCGFRHRSLSVRAKAAGEPSQNQQVTVESLRSGAVTFKFDEVSESPELKELANVVSPLLKGVSITVVGDNGELNANISGVLARLFEYAPLTTRSVVEQFAGQTVEEIRDGEGWGAVAAVEAVVMEQLCATVRTAVATLGGGAGAAARGDCWRHFFGHLCIWVEEVAQEGEVEVVQETPQNEAYSQAEIHVKVAKGRSDESFVQETVEQVLGAMKALLVAEDDSPGMDLAGKKLLYLKLGARGDWPNIMPPEWKPDAQS